MYHAMTDIGLSDGIYDMSQHLSRYHFPVLKDKMVLDAGCASGFFTRHFSNQGAEVIAWDINISAAEEMKKRTGVEVHLFARDVFDLKYESIFDMVFCGSLLMHAFYPVYLLKLLQRALKPGALLVLATAGVTGEEPIIRCEPHTYKDKTAAERQVRSSNCSLWWFSKSAIRNTLHTVGFENIDIKDEFNLESTDYGKSIGHNYNTLHFVVHCRKPNVGVCT